VTIDQFEHQLSEKGPAVHLLYDTVADYLIQRGQAAKIGDIANVAGKKINAGLKLIREALVQNDVFTGEERRWNLSIRSSLHRPVEGTIRSILREIGKPLSVQALANELAIVNLRSVDYFVTLLPTFLAKRPHYFRLSDGRWGLIEWLLDIESGDEDDIYERNFFLFLDQAQLDIDLAAEIKIGKDADYAEIAASIVDKFDFPVPTTIIQFVIWQVMKEDFDNVACYKAMLTDPRVTLLTGNCWMPTARVSELTEDLNQLSELADTALAEEVIMEGPYIATPGDIQEIYDFIAESGNPQKLSDIVVAVMEYSKNNQYYTMVYDGIAEGLREDTNFQLVGKQTWTLPSMIPQEVMEVPEQLLTESVDTSSFVDPETDVELIDDGLDGNLAVWVHDPRYEDFGGEHEVELSSEMADEDVLETRIPLLYDHHEMGTLKLRQADMGFFPTDTSLACITVHAGSETFQIWINNDELLIHGLSDWYADIDIPVGAMLTFKRGEELDDYVLTWEGETDELIVLTDERIHRLLNLRDSAEQENWSVHDIMTQVMNAHPEGAHFLTIWAEVNVVRRTPKRVVASNLSSYHCFSSPAGSERWKLDDRKIDQGRKKNKKKFIQ
jgi:DNA-directed RNA polymerase delta subunit